MYWEHKKMSQKRMEIERLCHLSLISHYAVDPELFPLSNVMVRGKSYKDSFIRRYTDMSACCSHFRGYVIQGKFYPNDPDKACDNWLCPVCAERRAAKLRSRLFFLRDVCQLNDAEQDYYFVTLTVKNVSFEDGREAVTQLNKAASLFKKESLMSSDKCVNGNRVDALGYIKHLEVTVNHEEQTLHPHLHFVVAMPKMAKFYSKNELLKRWTMIVNRPKFDKLNLYHIFEDDPRYKLLSTLDGFSSDWASVDVQKCGSLDEVICEVTKYCTKSVDIQTPEELLAVDYAVIGQIRQSAGGVFALGDRAEEYDMLRLNRAEERQAFITQNANYS